MDDNGTRICCDDDDGDDDDDEEDEEEDGVEEDCGGGVDAVVFGGDKGFFWFWVMGVVGESVEGVSSVGKATGAS